MAAASLRIATRSAQTTDGRGQMRRPHWYRPESERYLHLDLLRFAASLSIVLFHYRLLMAGPAGWSVGFLDLAPLRLAVDLFFIISGIVMSELYRGRLT